MDETKGFYVVYLKSGIKVECTMKSENIGKGTITLKGIRNLHIPSPFNFDVFELKSHSLIGVTIREDDVELEMIFER